MRPAYRLHRALREGSNKGRTLRPVFFFLAPRRSSLSSTKEETHEEIGRGRRINGGHLDHVIGTVRRTVSATNAVVHDVDFAARFATDRVGRAVHHALGILAVATGGRDVQGGKSRPGLAVKT